MSVDADNVELPLMDHMAVHIEDSGALRGDLHQSSICVHDVARPIVWPVRASGICSHPRAAGGLLASFGRRGALRFRTTRPFFAGRVGFRPEAAAIFFTPWPLDRSRKSIRIGCCGR